ncbi:helix-turn-helix transcriptional regulator [Streptomyces sp. H10-C2]|uniref:helix-turn-helix domain-containing protein n=1 Tax=unclassified Streptomyces TaxID=2593676 RepID=UPI0024BB888F|nr:MULTISPECIES: helix-turn-helix transcriptional regulator [unclassified Streptomyces]MDJ0347074.1 helix-turn-helix transcriptional regulator [Streptomyces sp. PH10-H1]MDJ0374420.1 helix-turn-helix transcriptional regulator [Streptomyces sp. H10-C2]
MALRTSATERQRRLGAELRKLREGVGMSISEAGDAIGMGRTHLSHVEAARTAIPTDRLLALCRTYGCTDEPYTEALVSLSEDSGKGWWSDYRRTMHPLALDMAELEAASNALSSYESLFIPGLFQIEDYTRSIFESDAAATGTQLNEHAVTFRMERQEILKGERPPQVHAIIHEAALHMRIGGPSTMRRQLLRLIELADLPHVTIQIVPFAAEGVSTLSTPFFIISSHGSTLETVLMEHPAQSLYLHEVEAVTKYRSQFARLGSVALPSVDARVTPAAHDSSRDSLGLIQHLLYTL